VQWILQTRTKMENLGKFKSERKLQVRTKKSEQSVSMAETKELLDYWNKPQNFADTIAPEHRVNEQ
jgi:hypothetical protein